MRPHFIVETREGEGYQGMDLVYLIHRNLAATSEFMILEDDLSKLIDDLMNAQIKIKALKERDFQSLLQYAPSLRNEEDKEEYSDRYDNDYSFNLAWPESVYPTGRDDDRDI